MALSDKELKVIQDELYAAMEAVAKKHNLTIGKSGMRYDDAGFKITAEFGNIAVMGDINPALYNDMKKNGYRYGVSVDDIGKVFEFYGKMYEVMGMQGRMAGVARDINTKKAYKIPVGDMATGLNKVRAPVQLGGTLTIVDGDCRPE